MLGALKLLPKILFDKKIKLILELIILAFQMAQDFAEGGKDRALDKLVKKIHPLLPADIRTKASEDEIYNVAITLADLVKKVEKLFK